MSPYLRPRHFEKGGCHLICVAGKKGDLTGECAITLAMNKTGEERGRHARRYLVSIGPGAITFPSYYDPLLERRGTILARIDRVEGDAASLAGVTLVPEEWQAELAQACDFVKA